MVFGKGQDRVLLFKAERKKKAIRGTMKRIDHAHVRWWLVLVVSIQLGIFGVMVLEGVEGRKQTCICSHGKNAVIVFGRVLKFDAWMHLLTAAIWHSFKEKGQSSQTSHPMKVLGKHYIVQPKS